MKSKKHTHASVKNTEAEPPSLGILLIAGLFFFFLIFVGLKIKKFLLPSMADRRDMCNEKAVAWGQTEYSVKNAPSLFYFLKIENRNEQFWYKEVYIGEKKDVRSGCETFIYKLPSHEQPSQDTKNSKGLEISIGTKKNGSYQKLLPVVLNVMLISNNKRSEKYDLNEVLTYFADNTVVRQTKDALYMSLPLGYKARGPQSSFSYDVIVVNGEEVQSMDGVQRAVKNDTLEFVSRDNGATWSLSK